MLCEIICQQKSIKLIILKCLFQCLVCDITLEIKGEIKFQAGVMEALQEAAEAIVINKLASKLLP